MAASGVPEDGGAGANEIDPLELFARTADGVVAVGPADEILGWNEGAAELLGFAADDVRGRPCFDVLAWHDRYGNPVCSSDCAACYHLAPEELVKTREVVARGKDGRAVWLSVTTHVSPPALRGRYKLVHVFREVSLPPELERLVAERLQGHAAPEGGGASVLEHLTRREREVLHLLADGVDTREIAERLFLSATTVRNHIQSVLAKLEVHSRVEAVSLYLRHRP